MFSKHVFHWSEKQEAPPPNSHDWLKLRPEQIKVLKASQSIGAKLRMSFLLHIKRIKEYWNIKPNYSFKDCICRTDAVFSPGGGGHDTPATVHGGSAAAAALRRVVVHAKVVSKLMGQSNRSTERVIRVILEDRESEKPSVKHNKRNAWWIQISNQFQFKTNKSNFFLHDPREALSVLPPQITFIPTSLLLHACFSLRKRFHMRSVMSRR